MVRRLWWWRRIRWGRKLLGVVLLGIFLGRFVRWIRWLWWWRRFWWWWRRRRRFERLVAVDSSYRSVRWFTVAVLLGLLGACSTSELAPVPSSPPVPVPRTVAPAERTTPTSTVPSSVTTTGPLAPLTGLALERIDLDLGFPILVFSSGSQTYVADKSGMVVLMHTGEMVLDIRDQVLDGGERGLLGAAFHPSYPDGSLLIVHYSDLNGDTQVSSFAVTQNVADPQTERSILTVEQPAGNHNGGMVQFDSAGYLYVGLGDGGGSGDRYGNGQNLSSLLGSIVRLEVSDQAGYSIPPDNPFVGRTDVAHEIWLWGLRNPWRFWIDEGADLMIIGDVGQNQYEEVDVVSMDNAGANLGWPITEGLHCFSPSSGCDSSGLTLPALEVSHADAGSCSITGGIVYRGAAIPELAGTYFFSDYCGGYVRGFELSKPGQVTDYTSQLGGPVGQVSSFGEGADGELYLATSQGVYRLVPQR